MKYGSKILKCIFCSTTETWTFLHDVVRVYFWASNCSVHVIYVPPPKYFKKISADEILVWKVARSLNIRDFHLYTWIPCYIQWLMRWINLFCPHNMGIIYLHTTFAPNIQPITTIKMFKRNISMSSRPFKTVTLGEKRCRIVITKNLELSLCQSIYIHLSIKLHH